MATFFRGIFLENAQVILGEKKVSHMQQNKVEKDIFCSV